MNFTEGQYLVIQSYPANAPLKIISSHKIYYDAVTKCQLENQGSDYSSYGVVIFYKGKFWDACQALPYKISSIQPWQIAKAIKDDGDLQYCNCSYPYLLSNQGIITCLKDDNGRSIDKCPNCEKKLL